MTTFYKPTKYKQTSIGQVPNEWEIKELGNVVDVLDYKRIPLSEQERINKKGYYPYCGANGVIDYVNEYIFDGEFVLMAEDGGDYGAFKKSSYIMNGKFWVNNHAHILSAKKGISLNSFVNYYLNFTDLGPYIVGSTRKKLNQDKLQIIKVALPSFPEQQKILEILTKIDDAIEIVNKSIEKWQKIKKAAMRQLLMRGIGHKKFKYVEEVGEIPEEWEVKKIKDTKIEIIDGDRGVNYPKKEDFLKQGFCLFLNAKNVTQEGFKFEEVQFISKDKDAILGKGKAKLGDLILTTRGTVGNVAFYNSEVPYKHIRINSGMVIIRNDDPKIDTKFLFTFMRSFVMQDYINYIAYGTAQPQLSVKEIKEFKITIPSIPEQQKISEILQKIDEVIQTKQQKRQHLERAKREMMRLLLTGKVRINPTPEKN